MSEFRQKLSICLSLLTGYTIYVNKQSVPYGIHAVEFTLDSYSEVLFNNGSIGQVQQVGNMKIKLKLLTGEIVEIPCDADEPIQTLKIKIEQKCGLNAIEQNLMFNYRKLKGGVIKDYGIKNGDTIYYVLKLKSNVQTHFYLDSILDEGWNYDFRGINDGSRKFYRGGLEYTRPVGCMRTALRVLGKFDNGNNTWLAQNNASGEWAVSYNGSNCDEHQDIVQWADKLNIRGQQGGSGVFCTPSFKVALDHSKVLYDNKTGKKYKIIFQNRVDPTKIKRASTVGGPDNYWYLTSPSYTRAYSICVFELN